MEKRETHLQNGFSWALFSGKFLPFSPKHINFTTSKSVWFKSFSLHFGFDRKYLDFWVFTWGNIKTTKNNIELKTIKWKGVCFKIIFKKISKIHKMMLAAAILICHWKAFTTNKFCTNLFRVQNRNISENEEEKSFVTSKSLNFEE